MDAEKLLSRLEKSRQIGKGRWVAVCPAHNDRTPSLHVTEKTDRILIHCKAGCGATEILDAVNLDYGVLQPEDDYRSESRRRISQDTVDDFVIELWEHDRARGRLATPEDKKRFREALSRSGKANGAVSKIIEEASKPLPSQKQTNQITEKDVAGLLTETAFYLNSL